MEKKGKNIGNQFWKLRSKHGKDKIFANPDLLWQEACNFFEWCDRHPIGRNKLMRPYTLKGLCIFLDIAFTTYQLYKKREEFKEVIERIEMICDTQKFTLAATNYLNANIISRDLGLVDKQEHTLDKKEADLSVLTDDELKLYYQLQQKIQNGQQFTAGTIQTENIRLHNGVERSEAPEAGSGTIGTD